MMNSAYRADTRLLHIRKARSAFCYLPRCGLCCHPLDFKDKTIVLVKGGKRLPEKFDFSPCREWCSHPLGQATAYHRRCAEGVIPLSTSEIPKNQEVDKGFTAALHQLTSQVLAYAYDPPPEEVARRNRWHANSLLASMVGGALPPEICQQIADAGTRDQAARTALAQLSRLREPEYVAACPAKDVYARHVSVEDLRYVSGLSNEKKGEDYVKVWSSPPTMADKIVVLVAEDHLGIREVRIVGSAGFPVVEEQPNIWWRAFTVKRENMLHGKTDGIKLRSLREFNSPAGRDRMTPTPSMKPPASVFRLKEAVDPLKTLWTHRSALNGSTTAGYIIAIRDRRGTMQLCAFQPWCPGEDTPVYRAERTFLDPDRDLLWFYFPIGPGEKITELWLRNANRQTRAWLLWVTNRGRCFPFSLRRELNQGYSQLAEIDGSMKQDMLLGVRGGTICEVMLQESAPTASETGRHLRLPAPRSPFPWEVERGECVFTSATLRNICEVIVCRGPETETEGVQFVAGLLLRDGEGRVGAVGCVRLDRLDRPLMIGSSTGWRLLLGRKRRVTGVQLAPYPEGVVTDSAPCLEGGWNGTLEWWSGLGNDTWVHHAGHEQS